MAARLADSMRSEDVTEKRDLARLADLLRVCAYTTVMIATIGSSTDMVRLSELARKVEAIADEMDDLDDDTVFDTTRHPSRRDQ